MVDFGFTGVSLIGLSLIAMGIYGLISLFSKSIVFNTHFAMNFILFVIIIEIVIYIIQRNL